MVTFTDSVRNRVFKAITVLDTFAPVQKVLLFGSYANGRADKWSDVDIAVFMDGIEDWDIFDQARKTYEVQRQAGWDIEPRMYPSSILLSAPPGSFARYIIDNGQLLWERGSDTQTEKKIDKSYTSLGHIQ